MDTNITDEKLFAPITKNAAPSPLTASRAIRGSQPLTDPKLNAVVTITREIHCDRGYVQAETIRALVTAGCRKRAGDGDFAWRCSENHLNYLDHISPIDLDPAFRGEKAALGKKTKKGKSQ